MPVQWHIPVIQSRSLHVADLGVIPRDTAVRNSVSAGYTHRGAFCFVGLNSSDYRFGTVVVITRGRWRFARALAARNHDHDPDIMKTLSHLALVRIFILLLGSTAFLAGCGSGQSITNDLYSWTAERAQQTVDSPNYVIQKGDLIEITVDGYPELSTTVGVTESGIITLPLVGDLAAEGVTRADLTDQIKARLSGYVKNSVFPSIKIKGAMEQKLIILGAVTGQGTYPAKVPISPFQALALAGGPSPNADLRHVRVFRGGDKEATIELDLSATLGSLPGRSEALPVVQPGDLIYVPREENVIRDFADLLRDVIVLFGIFAIAR